jgi:hypothetical protein
MVLVSLYTRQLKVQLECGSYSYENLWRWGFNSTQFTGPLCGGKWSASRPDHFTSGEGTPGTHWIGGWVGSRAVLDVVTKRKNVHTFVSLLGIERGHSARIQTLYWPGYPGRFSTSNTEARQVTWFWASSNHLSPTQPITLWFILMFPSHHLLGHASGHFKRGFPPKYCMSFPSHMLNPS